MKLFLVLSALSFCLFLCMIADSTAIISGYGTGDDMHNSYWADSEESTYLMRFGTTNGSYERNVINNDMMSLGGTGYQYSARSGKTHTSNTNAKSLGYMTTGDIAGVHMDQTNKPATLCDTQNLALPPGNNTTNETPGAYPMTQDALMQVLTTGQGNGVDAVVSYESDIYVGDGGFKLSYDQEAYTSGSDWRDFRYDVIAGHNNTEKAPQYREHGAYHATQYSNDTTGMTAGGVFEFVGHTYDGGNMPLGWEIEEEPANETVNNTTVEEAQP